jgi:hypothetical protein
MKKKSKEMLVWLNKMVLTQHFFSKEIILRLAKGTAHPNINSAQLLIG